MTSNPPHAWDDRPSPRAILDSLDHAVVVVDPALRVLYANRAAIQIAPGFLTRADQLRSLEEFLGPIADEEVVRVCRLVLARGEPVKPIERALPDIGTVVSISFLPLIGTSAVEEVVVVLEDVTSIVESRRRIEGLRRVTRALARADQPSDALGAVVHEVPSLINADRGAIYLLDSSKGLVPVSGWSRDGTDEPIHDLDSRPPEALAQLAMTGRQTVAIPDLSAIPGVDSALAANAGIGAAIAVPISGGGDPRGVLLLAFAAGRQTFSSEEIGVAEALSDEIAAALDRADLLGRLAREALSDPLTGLANRRAFEDALTRQFAQAQRLDRRFAIIMADLDDMKRINDHYGHAAGDKAIQAVAGALASITRSGDLAARVGGDEFTVLLPEADRAGARLVIERIQAAISAAPISSNGDAITIGLSAGAGAYPEDGDTLDAILQAADNALYQVKSSRQVGRQGGTAGN